MEDKKEITKADSKMAKYARWIVGSVIGALILATMVMAIYRKFME